MFGIFSNKPIISPDEQLFQHETYAWLLRNFGGDEILQTTTLVLPTREHFPTVVASEEEAVLETFLTVKRYAGMENWSCTLARQEDDINTRVASTLSIQNAPNNPLGTFSVDENNQVIITYSPALARDPMRLVSTFAHELAHYLTATTTEPPPGGWENWEFATDIAATFLGFGIFMVNSAFNFRQYTDVDSQGWQYSSSGYLSETEHLYALSLFLLLHNGPLSAVKPYLKSSLWPSMKRAFNQAEKSQIVRELKNIQVHS